MSAPKVDLQTPQVSNITIWNMDQGIVGEWLGRVVELIADSDPSVKKIGTVFFGVFSGVLLFIAPFKLLFSFYTGSVLLLAGSALGVAALVTLAEKAQWPTFDKYSSKEATKADVEEVVETIPKFETSTFKSWTIKGACVDITELKIEENALSIPSAEAENKLLKALEDKPIATVKGTGGVLDKPDLLVRYDRWCVYKINCLFCTIHLVGAKQKKYSYIRESETRFTDLVGGTHGTHLFFEGGNFTKVLLSNFLSKQSITEVPGSNFLVRVHKPT